VNQRALAELLAVSTLTLATTGPGGEPHAAPVYFAVAGELRLYFFSDPHSRHSQDLDGDPRAAAAIYPECEGWQDIRGLQLRGEVWPVVPGAEWDQAWKAYLQKFPFVGKLQAVVARNQLYVLRPEWIRLVDNRQGFGFKEEWTLP
jgi:uncharacterized protein